MPIVPEERNDEHLATLARIASVMQDDESRQSLRRCNNNEELYKTALQLRENTLTMRLVIISGHSGSGKTSALNILEDVGFTCIDNLPASLLQNLITQLNSGNNNHEELNIAVGIDARNLVGDLNKIPEILDIIEADGVSVTVLFLYARRADLLRRYSETRRRHP